MHEIWGHNYLKCITSFKCTMRVIYFFGKIKFILLLTVTKTEYIGCYMDHSTRDLDVQYVHNAYMTLKQCVEMCDGYKYLGLQVFTHPFLLMM